MTATVAGYPILITATLESRLRSTIALVQWVVPSMACLIIDRSIALSASTFARTSSIPLVTSSVVGDFAFDMTWPSSSSNTASVFVPPTSIPSL